jgi:hypothetical protein
MAMTLNEKVLVVWIFVVVVFRLLFHHVLSWAFWAFQQVVALCTIPLPALAKYAAGICCMNVLP